MRRFLGTIVLPPLMAIPGFGQGNTGTILGTVSDSSGAIVPEVKIVVLNVDTGIATTVQSDHLGNYRAQFLPPGSYTAEVTLTPQRNDIPPEVIPTCPVVKTSFRIVIPQ